MLAVLVMLDKLRLVVLAVLEMLAVMCLLSSRQNTR